MLYIIHTEPQFIVRSEMVVHTAKGEYYLEKGKMLGLLKTEDERLFIGTGEEDSDQLEVTGKISGAKLLELCEPARFELALDQDGDSYIAPVLLEEKVTLNEKILRISLTEEVSHNPIEVYKIEYL